MSLPSSVTVRLPDPHASFAPNTLIIDKDGQRAFIGAVRTVDLSEEKDNHILVLFKLYRCELIARECDLLREDAITEDFSSYILNGRMEFRFVLLDDGDSFILVYANIGIKVEGSFKDFGKALSFYRIPKDPRQPVQRLGSVTLPNLVNDSRVIKLAAKKVTPNTTYFFIVRQAGLEPTEAHLFSFTGSYNDIANPANWRHEGRIFFQTPSPLSREYCPYTELTPTFMANIGHLSREGYLTLWAYHFCPRKFLRDREMRLAVVLFDPTEKKFYNVRGEPVEYVDLGEPRGRQSNAIISIPIPEQYKFHSRAQTVIGQVIVGEKSVFATVMLLIVHRDVHRIYLLLEIDRESMKLKSIRTVSQDAYLALQGILSGSHLLVAMEEVIKVRLPPPER